MNDNDNPIIQYLLEGADYERDYLNDLDAMRAVKSQNGMNNECVAKAGQNGAIGLLEERFQHNFVLDEAAASETEVGDRSAENEQILWENVATDDSVDSGNCNELSAEEKIDYHHPVFRKISKSNGQINRMTKSELEAELKKRGLSTHGVKEVLKKRLKTFHRERYLKTNNISLGTTNYQYYIVVDFEATCDDKQDRSFYRTEIIEFPAVVVDAETMKICKIFHRYVKPRINPRLSDYCVNLTGITQDQVDNADPFPVVLQDFTEFLENNNLFSHALVTDGPNDFGRFFVSDIKWCGLQYPKFAKRWVNLKKVFGNFYSVRKPNIKAMLEHLNMDFEGRLHSGIDDATNLANILVQMLKDGANPKINEKIDLSTFSSNALRPVFSIVKPVSKRYKNKERGPKTERQSPVLAEVDNN